MAELFPRSAWPLARDDRSMTASVIRIHAHAPPKAATGAPCNGCGVCCLAQPCPVGMLVSRRRFGPCAALQWDPSTSRYRCGLVAAPGMVLGRGTAATAMARVVSSLARRWIAAGSGCDSDAEVLPGQGPQVSAAAPRPTTTPARPA